jgi:hypothetical protein
LNATRSEPAHFSKHVNAEELLGEQSAKLSELKSEENFDFKSVNDCPKTLKKHFSDKDPEKECVIEAYLNFFSNIGAVLVQSAKTP